MGDALELSGAGEGRKEKFLFDGCRVSVLQGEEVLGADGGNGHRKTRMPSLPLTCAPKWLI